MSTLKAPVASSSGTGGGGALVEYYAGLADDKRQLGGPQQGPVDYYLDPDEPAGRWFGRGCDAVGLAGEVEADQLRRMLQARHPVRDVPVGRGFSDRSARGFDATFSAPKSVSVLWALSPDPWVRAEVLAAHDAAVTSALGWLETHGAVTRRGKDGVDQVDTQGLTVALFRQHTSRSIDPQLHTHAVIWSKVQDPTGAWLALDARFLKFQQRSIGWIYDSALRSELTGRLGVTWGDVVEGHADIEGVDPELRALFSQRSAEVDAKLTELLTRWSAEHDGAEPDPRTIARLHRSAVIASRPGKEHPVDGWTLRGDWTDRAEAAGFDLDRLPSVGPLGNAVTWDSDVVAEALRRVAERSATWIRADLAREIAALLPAGAAANGPALVALVDELAEVAAAQCLDLHPAVDGPCRRDGRPLGEHVVNRRLTTPAVLEQEVRLLDWAASAVDWRPVRTVRTPPGLDDCQAAAASAVAGAARLVLVIGPAGAGKTSMLAAAVEQLRHDGRPVLGLAPSGKAADVLAREAGCPAITLAKLLHATPTMPPTGTTVIVDEAGMAATGDLDLLVNLASAHHWRLVCVGDPHQLPAVERGGMFADWCERLPAARLVDVHRFRQAWEATASLDLRAGRPQGVRAYAEHGRLQTTHPALVGDRVARLHDQHLAAGRTVAITTASVATARQINETIQQRHRPDQPGQTVELRDGTHAAAGDRVATRHNDRRLVTSEGAGVRNRQTWTVQQVDHDGALVVSDPDRGHVTLPSEYVAQHVELGWAVTGYGNQGTTVDSGIAVIEPSTTGAGAYVAMTRGRDHNTAVIVDETGTADAVDVFTGIIQRPENGITAHAMRDRLHSDAVAGRKPDGVAPTISGPAPDRDPDDISPTTSGPAAAWVPQSPEMAAMLERLAQRPPEPPGMDLGLGL